MRTNAGDNILGLREIFCAVRQQPTVDDKARVLDELCADNEPLRQQVVHLLSAAASSSPLDRMGARLNPTELYAESDPSQLPVVDIENHPLIGPYKLLEQIGEGGMGVVYMAQQQTPIRRTVALKVIKPGMDSRQVVARFEAERQALAMMNHPHIAKVLDAGATESSSPYIVMELVKGIPITEFCDRHKLDVQQRLELFLKVCGAVQHAHQKGVIHRDLKPSNILVELEDVKAVPKVIDFGVAKATQQALTERTLVTGFSQMIGTPLYMSPEQAQLNSLDVDTRSDIYSLGVLLYELLTGSTPFDREMLKQAGFDEMRRIIREVEPPRPSHHITTLAAAQLSTVAGQRQVDPRKLSSTMRGELDWIVMKALEKDRARRYESASALAADVQRYLDGDAVLACPPSSVYRVTKFIRRYRVLLSTVALLAIVLTGGLVTTAWQAIRARRAEQASSQAEQLANQQLARALQAEKVAELQAARAQQSAEAAELDAAIAKAVNEFIAKDLLAQADPNNEPDRDIPLRLVVDRAALTVADRFENQPLVEAAIRHTLGETFYGLGLTRKAEEQLSRALTISVDHLGNEDPKTLAIHNRLARSIWQQGRFTESQQMFQVVLDLRRKSLGEEHPDTLESTLYFLESMQGLGEKGIEEQFRELWKTQQRILGDEHPQTLETLSKLAGSSYAEKRFSEAEELFSEAEELFRKVAETRERLSGKEHPTTLKALALLAAAISSQGRFAESEKIRSPAVEVMRRVLGEEHQTTILFRSNQTSALVQQGRLVEAETSLREELEILTRTLGKDHLNTIFVGMNLVIVLNKSAKILNSEKKFAEAESLSRGLLEISRRERGDEHGHTRVLLNELARAIFYQKRYDEAEKLFRQRMELCQHMFGKEHEETIRSITDLSAVAWQLSTAPDPNQRDPAKAVEISQEIVQLLPENANFRRELGIALYCNSQWQESIENFEKANSMTAGDKPVQTLFWAMSHWRLGNKEIARDRYAEGAAWITTHPSKDAEQKRFLEETEQLLELSELDRSELIAAHYAKLNVNDPKQLTERGLWYQLQEKQQLAVDDFTAVLQMQPDSKSLILWRSRGFAYYKLARHDDALLDLSRAIEIKPNDAYSISIRAEVNRELGQLDSALVDRSRVIELEPSTNHRYFERAEVYRERGEYELALADIEKGFAIDALHDAAWYPRARAFALSGDIYSADLQQFDKALEQYTKAIDLEPTNANYVSKREKAIKAITAATVYPL